MIAPEFPKNEKKRQREVEKYNLLDTLPEEKFDNITKIMAHICNTPISLITLLDKERNFLKSHYGIPSSESPRKLSFCGHAINSEEDIMIVKDARLDNRFEDNPLVTEQGVVFYAGVPLVNNKGYKLGTLCVFDTEPKELNEDQINALKTVSKQVILLFEEIIKNKKLKQLKLDLEEKNRHLEKFAGIVSHDLKSPLSNIILLTELIGENVRKEGDEESENYLDILKKSSFALKDYIDGLLDFYRSDNLIAQEHEEVHFFDFLNEVKKITDPRGIVNFTVESKEDTLFINKIALLQVLTNLIINAIKYNDKNTIEIKVSCEKTEDYYVFSIADNGVGIEKEFQQKMFDLFSRAAGQLDRNGMQGSGIGLATVKKIIDSLGGTIEVSSEIGEGTLFTFTVERE